MDIRKRLSKIYRNNITDNDPGKTIKFEFRFKDTNISVFYDNYDEKIPVFFMILEYKKNYIFKNFNINLLESSEFSTKYIPTHVLENLKTNDTLEEFITIISKILSVSDEYSVYEYNKDLMFSMYTENKVFDSGDIRKIKPFLQGIRRRTMQETHLESLYDALSIDMKNLKFLQSKEYTIITTKNPYHRRPFVEEIKKIII